MRLILGLLAASLSAQPVDVFVGGEQGYPIYRIPSVVTTESGTVLAFAEARQSKSDHAENDIVLRRSTDGGSTWGDLIVVAEQDRDSLNNPQAVVLPRSGRILLMYQSFPHLFHSRKIEREGIELVEPGFSGPRVQRSFLTQSDDDGKTWSKPRDITRSVKRPAPVVAVASGPGIGIVLRRGEHKGRVIMPFNESLYAWDKREFHVFAVYSDDEGKTWRYAETAPDGPQGWGNEVQMVELADGSLMLNSRSFNGAKLRKTAVSKDGGETWSPLTDDPQLPEPMCMGSILRLSDPLDGEPSRILYSGPGAQSGRTQGTIRMSTDEGKTWPISRLLEPEGFAYSVLTKLPDGRIGCLYETDSYERIVFARFSSDWLAER